MRARRRWWLLGVVLLFIASFEIVFQPVQRKPKAKDFYLTFRFDKPFEKLVPRGQNFTDAVDDLLTTSEDTFLTEPPKVDPPCVIVTPEATDRVEAQEKAGKILESLRKKFGGVTPLDENQANIEELPEPPVSTFWQFAVYHPEPHIRRGLDLQGGSHLVLQIRQAVYEFKFPEQLGKTRDELAAKKSEVRIALLDAGMKDVDVAIPDKDTTRLYVRTQADKKRADREMNEILLVLRRKYGAVDKAREPEVYDFGPDILDSTVEIVRKRVDALGVSEPLIQKQGINQIVVELPGIKDPQKAIDAIGETARLEFRKIPERYKVEVDRGKAKDIINFSDEQGNVLRNEDVYYKSELILTGADLKPNATVGYDEKGRACVNLEFNKAGGRTFGDFTRHNVKKYLGIFLDKKPISVPIIEEPITGGRCRISGGFESTKEAKTLMILLNAGALPVPIDVVENRTVSATLGKDSVQKSLFAGTVAAVIVVLFMLVMYRLPGLLADIALVIYVLLVLACMVVLDATLTLPGIAGFILSIGMAVDANVLIFERMKEELRTDKTFRSALQAGFDRAWTAIADSQITTLLAAAVLFYYGTGPIKGFAVTLTVGIIVDLFTAITVTRLFMSIVADTALGKNLWLFCAPPRTERVRATLPSGV